MRRIIIVGLMLMFFVGFAACGFAADTAKSDTSLINALNRCKSMDRSYWSTACAVMEQWDKPLTADERTAVREFAAKTDKVDWLAHYRAVDLLLRNREGWMPSLAVCNSEAALASLRTTKGISDSVDIIAIQIAAYGNAVVPFLQDVLSYSFRNNSEYQRTAIRALGRIGTPEAIDILLSNVGERNYNTREAITALLNAKNDDATVDFLAKRITTLDDITEQENMIFLVRSLSIPVTAKRRLYSHYDQFSNNGKRGVIRALGSIGDKTSFDELGTILMKENGSLNGETAIQMASVKNCDPGRYFENALKAGKRSEGLMLSIGNCNCKALSPYLQKIVTESNTPSAAVQTCAAGALCKLGVDYENNAKIVRAALNSSDQSYWAIQTAALLNDDETVKLVASKILVKTISNGQIEFSDNYALSTLGKMRNKLAAKLMQDQITKLPTHTWRQIADSLKQLGTDLGDKALLETAIGLLAAYSYNNLDFMQCIAPSMEPEIKANLEAAAPFLKKNPKLIGLLFDDHSENMPDMGRIHLIELSDLAWTPKLTPILKKVIQTNTSKCQLLTGPGRSIIHYDVRQRLAQLLQKKTGKSYTYIDADGQTKNAEDMP